MTATERERIEQETPAWVILFIRAIRRGMLAFLAELEPLWKKV